MPSPPLVVWQGVDAPRMEAARLSTDPQPLLVGGTQIGADYALRYQLDGDRLRVEVLGGASAELGLDGADFFDLGFSPLFNSLPVWRDDLLSADAGARDYVMRWVEVPSLTVHRSPQRYEPVGDAAIRFVAGDFTALIRFGADGLVDSYEGLAVRVSPRPAGGG